MADDAGVYGGYADYQRRTEREIPLVVLRTALRVHANRLLVRGLTRWGIAWETLRNLRYASLRNLVRRAPSCVVQKHPLREERLADPGLAPPASDSSAFSKAPKARWTLDPPGSA